MPIESLQPFTVHLMMAQAAMNRMDCLPFITADYGSIPAAADARCGGWALLLLLSPVADYAHSFSLWHASACRLAATSTPCLSSSSNHSTPSPPPSSHSTAETAGRRAELASIAVLGVVHSNTFLWIRIALASDPHNTRINFIFALSPSSACSWPHASVVIPPTAMVSLNS